MRAAHKLASESITRGTIQRVAQAINNQVQQWPARGTHWHMARAIAESLADELKDELERADVSKGLFLAACGVA